jgi:uroporphyrin-III C-methyltransferase / precorrin-2 dehydrogenase / sirohydrochlorin ferrochelatase
MAFPVQLVGLAGRRVLVAGAGQIAASKIEALLDARACVHVVAEEIGDELLRFVTRIDRVERRPAVPQDVEGAALVIAATNDRATNRALADRARALGILVNAVDDPESCTFFAPAIVKRGAVTIAIGTDGASPLFSAQLRRLLEAMLPEEIGSAADLFARLRDRGLKGLAKKSSLLRALADRAVGRFVDEGEPERALDRIEQLTKESEGAEAFPTGTVAIVGAGPGSKALLTLRALDRIQQADVILHDALVERDVLALAMPAARIINVGRRATHAEKNSSHEVTIALMIREARAGNRVVRLHAGDAFVFGRGGEEAEALDAAGLSWEIVPGVSAAIAAPAAAGIPLTHRGEARGFTVRTGHTKEGWSRAELPKDEETVVVLMGLGAVGEIMNGLLEEGYAPDTPAAAVSNATRSGQKIVVATIATLRERIEQEKLEAPATLVVGKVVKRARLERGYASSSKEEAA